MVVDGVFEVTEEVVGDGVGVLEVGEDVGIDDDDDDVAEVKLTG